MSVLQDLREAKVIGGWGEEAEAEAEEYGAKGVDVEGPKCERTTPRYFA